MRILWALGLGAALGVTTSAADYFAGGGYADVWRLPAVLLNAGATWAALAFLCGYLARRTGWAMVAGAVGLISAVVSYYAFGSVFGDRIGVDVGNLLGALRYWLVGGLIVGPLLGLAGALARRPGALGFVAALTVPVGTLAELFLVRRLGPQVFAEDAIYGTGVSILAIAGVVGIAAVVRSKTRPTAAAAAGEHAEPAEPAAAG